MRKILTGLAAGLMALAMVLPLQAKADEAKSLLDQILDRGTLRVGTTGDYPPYSELDPSNNTYKGYEIDVVTQLAADLGVKVEFVPTTWETLAAGIQAGKYDVAASGITLTLDRLKSIGFSAPYLDSPLVPLVQVEDGAKYAAWRDLDKQGIRIAVQSGTSAEESAKKNFTKAEIVPIVAPALDYQELLAGKVDAAITDTVFIKKALAQYSDKLVAVDPTHAIEGQPNAMMTVRGDYIWQNWLDTWIGMKAQSGFFDALFAKWIAGS
ncbi:transporter substrate-binding domain-containing protein [Dongia rigui]|uniref:Transporter substrate-binding domain-containing protein n=1 Tax=Dongia rigui TaxID=940149 RepID=A0ABU5E3Z4_9PROT|nr:transporter substrate-binding domain-containing protein [Dongia rigui]MDY0874358.1 transporter substrate-binding domain-containing protein [Dongia rigui]